MTTEYTTEMLAAADLCAENGMTEAEKVLRTHSVTLRSG
jgi:hypothetical protein